MNGDTDSWSDGRDEDVDAQKQYPLSGTKPWSMTERGLRNQAKAHLRTLALGRAP
jgi:hypothetical protein